MPLPPLPPPDVAAVYVFAGNEQHGPMTRRDLLASLDAGRFGADDLFWFAEVEGWVRLGDHPELVADLRQAPAPAPAQDPAQPAGDESIDPSLLRTTALSSEDLRRAVSQGGQQPQAAAGSATSIHGHGAQGAAPASEGGSSEGRSSMATIAMSPDTVAEAVAQSQGTASQGTASQGGTSGGDAAAQTVIPSAGFAEQAAGSTQDEELDRLFVDLVESSWAWVSENRFASHIDEVFLGALVTGTLDAGFSLIDLTSDGTHHYLRFENLEGAGGAAQGSRLIVRLRHLTGDLARAKVLGQRASVVIGYGEKAPNAQQVIQALKAELKSGFLHDSEPGTITVDGDLASGYVYAQVDLHWRLDEYVHDDYRIETDMITRHVSACAHALRKYLRGRFA